MRRFQGNPTLFILIMILLYEGPIRALLYSGPSGLLDWVMDTVLILPAIVVGLSFHEFGHAKVAQLCGDNTPVYQGRVTLDPRAHIDPFGLISLVFIHFGWGKPVMINPLNFRERRRDSILVGLAGVTMNLIVAVVAGFILKILTTAASGLMTTSVGTAIGYVIVEIVIINISLMLFNLLPVPPLDGFGVITDIFNLYNTRFYSFVRQYSFMILMFMILLNIPSMLISRPMVAIVNFILTRLCGVSNWWYFL